jgi:phage terminase large subunit-like protein
VSAARDYAAIAEGYARDVVGRKIPACRWVRLACKRHLGDLGKSRRKAYPFRFDAGKAARACRFIELLPHTKGKWAAQKSLLRLEPWQLFIVASIFGWVKKASGLRRFRIAFLVIPRKNGKSPLAAAIGVYMFCFDGEFGAEVYSGATNEKQAWEIFRPARLMIQRTPPLKHRFEIEVGANTLQIAGDGSRFEPVIGKPGDGASPSCALHDEYHEHADRDQVNTMETGMAAREQPLQVIVTTAGDNLAGPCYADIQDHRKVLEGVRQNDELFYLEYTIDKGDDWKSEAALIKANPNWGVSVNSDFLRSRQRDAVQTPRKAGIFKTKHLNLWVSARSAYFDIEAWRRCTDPAMPARAVDCLALPHLQGRRCKLSLDLSSKIDIAALEYLFEPLDGEASAEDPYIRIGRYFLPADTVANVEAYTGWDAEQLLDVTPGNIIDYAEIEAAIITATEIFDVDQVAYDPFQATYLVTRLQAKNVPVIEYRQTVLNYSEPMKQLDALIRARRIRHNGCKVMEWEVSNVVAKLDRKDNVYPNKPDGQHHLKIDSPVALIGAVGLSMAAEEQVRSFWETAA